MTQVPIPPTPDTPGVCLWPVDPACKTDEWTGLDPETQIRALTYASATLHRLTGRRVGGCPVTIRPVLETRCCFVPQYDGLSGYTTGGAFQPGINTRGAWVNCWPLGAALPDCSVPLPPPVGRVDEVRVGSQVVAPTDYAVLDGSLLVWTGAGDCPWPLTQDINTRESDPGYFAVTYLNSYPVDTMGAYAAGVLALEFARACSGAKCRLPAGVTSVVRAGVSYEITPGAFPDGFTGIREVDAFIALWNPRGMERQASVWSPGPRTNMTTWRP